MTDIKLTKQPLTKYERARLIGARSLQISMGAPLMQKLSVKKLEEIKYDPLEIAKLEFEAGVIPLDIKELKDLKPEEPKKSKKD